MTIKDSFIQRANKKHKNKFDYSFVNYINAKTKVVIVCSTHGEFEQTPDKHLQSTHGCLKCALELRKTRDRSKYKPKPLKYTWDDIHNKLITKFPVGYKFSCDDYTGIMSKINVSCDIHGDSTSSPHSLLHSTVANACKTCAIIQRSSTRTLDFSAFVSEATTMFNGKYTYKCDNFVNRQSKVTCTCNIHGDFVKKAQKHLSGQGCIKCMYISLSVDGKLPGGYCETNFKRSVELQNKDGYIYYIKLGDLYKIGITVNIKQRLNSIKNQSKCSVEIIDLHKTTLYEAFKLEQKILETYKEYRVHTEASTELFSKDVLLGKILK